MDFTPQIYHQLLLALKENNFSLLPFRDYLNNSKFNQHSTLKIHNSSIVILRHDVDRLPQNSLRFAKLEADLGIKGTYYFRIVPESFDVEIIKEIAELGHEVGYHYEDVDLAIKNSPKGVLRTKLKIHNSAAQAELIDLAYERFCKNLAKMREVADIKTICMHGSPRSKYDNKIIWEKYGYKDLGIIGEPYLDINWNEVGYLTDTGRRWNGYKYSIRDKVNSKFHLDFKTTQQIIDNVDKLPDKLMITIHPERWTDNWVLWGKQLVVQNLKNVVKRFYAR